MIVTATYEHKLSDADIERIAERVVRKLKQDEDQNKLLNITESAKYCGVSKETFWRWRKRYKKSSEYCNNSWWGCSVQS
ncbi:helix-turn-helix domain-containing protein [Ligilactobacillus salivarius]|uniref:helix-turn-helix domain-containing protein n=1 Tax=Ligilactobacillus salivarius TaxID=1624 RepID=UPI001369B5F9|nr:helix-turn-helix domain-containing protein [Ligilactobacillus salivarius]